MAQDPAGEGLGDEGEVDTSPDLDLVTIFRSSNTDAELEANNIHSMLQASGISSIVVGASVIPSLEFQVQVPREDVEEAERLIAEARAAGPEAASEAEAAGEEGAVEALGEYAPGQGGVCEIPGGTLLRLGVGLALAGMLCAFQRPFRVYLSIERYDDVPLPPDYQEKSEWVFGRLMYPEHPYGMFGSAGRRGFRFGSALDWREGGTGWTQDYPRADRHFAQAVRRLTRVQARSVEQPVNPDDLDDFYNWPWLNAGEMGDWKLTDPQVKTLREYLLRGGFLMLDDFWGPEEYARFNETMRKVFPDRPVVDMPSSDPIFHTVYDLDDRYQILGQWALSRGGFMSQRAVGTVAHWLGIYDDHHRVMVAISFNSDVGDSWEWADEPAYPEKFSALGIRLGIDYVIYSMTH